MRGKSGGQQSHGIRAGAANGSSHEYRFLFIIREGVIKPGLDDGLNGRVDEFYYHQWAEVHTGRWIPVDPVFGQVRADATHIKLSQGDLVEQLRLLNTIGAISIEVLDYQTDEETGDHLPTGAAP